MHRLLLPTLALLTLALSGCNTASSRLREYPESAAQFDKATRDKIARGVVEPGFTPEMVYMALGKPSEPAEGLASQTKDGTWIYHEFHPRNERDFVRAGYRRRVVFDPVKRSDTVVNEPVDPRLFPSLRPRSVHVTFREGRVVEVQRVAEI
jgi:hypothetical protein